MALNSFLRVIELGIFRDGLHQSLMTAHDFLLTIHPDYLIQLGKQIEPMGNQQHNTVLCHSFKIRKHLFLRSAIQRRKRVVQNQNGAAVDKGARQRKTLLLTAGEPQTAGTYHRLHSFRHFSYLTIQTNCFQISHDIRIRIAHKKIVLYGILKQLWIMSQIAHNSGSLCGVYFLQLQTTKVNAARIGVFTKEGLAQCGFAAGHWAGDADDLSGLCGKAEIMNGFISGSDFCGAVGVS